MTHVIMNLPMKDGVYVIFLTEVAVAWFVAGAISPLFNRPSGISETLPYLISIFMTAPFIYMAKFIERKKRKK